MSLNAATIEFLLARGLTGEDLLEVARCMEKKADRTASERQARHRERKRNARDSNGVTPNEYISNPTPLPTEPDGSSGEGDSPRQAANGQHHPKKPVLTEDHVLESWNEAADRLGLPRATSMAGTRLRQCRARIRGSPDPVRDFGLALDAIERSDFLRGDNERGWRANIDFMLQASSFQKLIEGAYDRPH